jgi:hypothetical protein
MEKLQARAEARVTRREQLKDSLTSFGLFSLPDLINNQPQLYAELRGVFRDSLVGQDETHLAVTWEIGWPNVNSLRHYAAQRSDACRSEAQCLPDFIKDPRYATGIDAGQRLALSLTWADVSSYDFSRPEDDIALSLEGEHKLVFSLAYGRYWRLLGPEASRARFDVGLSYEDVSSDPNRQDRGLFNVSLTQKLTDGTDFTVGFVYANKAEFRGDVNDEISAHAGFKYKFLRPD